MLIDNVLTATEWLSITKFRVFCLLRFGWRGSPDPRLITIRFSEPDFKYKMLFSSGSGDPDIKQAGIMKSPSTKI